MFIIKLIRSRRRRERRISVAIEFLNMQIGERRSSAAIIVTLIDWFTFIVVPTGRVLVFSLYTGALLNRPIFNRSSLLCLFLARSKKKKSKRSKAVADTSDSDSDSSSSSDGEDDSSSNDSSDRSGRRTKKSKKEKVRRNASSDFLTFN